MAKRQAINSGGTAHYRRSSLSPNFSRIGSNYKLGLIISQIRAGFVKLTSESSVVKKNLTVSRPSMFLLPREASEGQSRKTGDFKRTG